MSSGNSATTVTILGSGTCVPSLKRSSCSVLIEIGNDKLLFDSGPGTMRRLLEADTTIFEISYIFYSHFHPDHTGEFVPFLFSTKYPDGRQRKDPLTVTGGRGFLDFYSRLKNVYGHWIEIEPGLLNIIELDNNKRDTHQFNDFSVQSAPMDHNEESIAYRMTSADGKSIVYSGDTDYNENLIELAENADLFICESALPDKFRVKGHLTPSLAGKIARQAGVKKLVLTHFYPECGQTDIEQECRKFYSGPLVLAEDLMRIEVGA
ncbi:MAG: MBL fold metallo-hydrolase [Desulfobacterales bacterium]|nr:MAG: MBL fold metallo-hydrolase [Desulfobacterales bacterium]